MKPKHQVMHKLTQILKQRVDTTNAAPVVTPIYQNSAFEAHSPFFYTRKNNPNVEELEQVFCALEESAHAVCCSTGMAAISNTLLLLKPGDHLVINQLIYGCSYVLFERFCEQFQIALTVLDLSTKEGVLAIPQQATMVLFETPTNPFVRSIDIAAVAQQAKKHNPSCLIVVDNTWATPLFQQPLLHGADLALYSATKYFSGHSDVMGGVLTTNDANLAQKLRDARFYHGAVMDPNSAWLLRRSMQTFTIRMRAHGQTTIQIRDWLASQSGVEEVFYPDVDGQQLTGYATLLFFTLNAKLSERYDDFVAALQLFDTGTGMACVTSMVARPYTGSHASMNEQQKQQMGLTCQLVRLSIGLEEVEDLIADLQQAFDHIGANND
jgi:cystathionine gamma-lyase/cystathionine gamma-lyase/homocysteine desulfhydrase